MRSATCICVVPRSAPLDLNSLPVRETLVSLIDNTLLSSQPHDLSPTSSDSILHLVSRNRNHPINIPAFHPQKWTEVLTKSSPSASRYDSLPSISSLILGTMLTSSHRPIDAVVVDLATKTAATETVVTVAATDDVASARNILEMALERYMRPPYLHCPTTLTQCNYQVDLSSP